ncbi:MAG: hypothetical protein V1685_02610, partial [Parcubacteria group bacterium]
MKYVCNNATIRPLGIMRGPWVIEIGDDPELDQLYALLKVKHNGFAHIEISPPFRPRTTGWKSQSHHLRGHARQLAGLTGYSMTEMMDVIKHETVSWPEKIIRGRAIKA